jgi:hypothetical protein
LLEAPADDLGDQPSTPDEETRCTPPRPSLAEVHASLPDG